MVGVTSLRCDLAIDFGLPARRFVMPFYEQYKAQPGSNARSEFPTVTKALRFRRNNGLIYGAGYVEMARREGREKQTRSGATLQESAHYLSACGARART